MKVLLTEYQSKENNKSAKIFKNEDNSYQVQFFLGSEMVADTKLNRSAYYAEDMAKNYTGQIASFGNKEFLSEFIENNNKDQLTD